MPPHSDNPSPHDVPGDAADRHAHGHEHGGDHAGGGDHGHHLDQGWRGLLRYLRHGPRMWQSDVNRAVVELVDPRPGETVIDIGAGFGPGVAGVTRRGASAVAIEPTPNLRKVLDGRRRLTMRRGHVEIVDGTAENLPLVDDSADAVMSVNTMHHWSDLGAGIAEIARVLAPGGRVILVDEDFDHPDHPTFDPDADDQHHHRHEFIDVDPVAIADQLRAAGFVDVEGDERRVGGCPVKFVAGRRPDHGG